MTTEYTYNTKLVSKISGATENQLKYWVKNKIIFPQKNGKINYYSFRELIKIRLIISLKKKGLSFQKIKKGLNNLNLPDSDKVLSQLVIYTDGIDMIVVEKGQFFSAITKQTYLKFDTEEFKADIIRLHEKDSEHSVRTIDFFDKKVI